MLPFVIKSFFLNSSISSVLLVLSLSLDPLSALDKGVKNTIDQALEKAKALNEKDDLLRRGFKQSIDESLKKAKEKGLDILNDKKCPNDCVKKQGTKLSDFIDQREAHPSFLENDQSSKEERVIFISKSIPKEALKAFAAFAKRQKARLVIRGMINNSLLETAKFVEEIGHPVDIDPPLFQRHGIKTVPTFLNQKGGKSYLLKGNVTADFAFLKLEEEAKK